MHNHETDSHITAQGSSVRRRVRSSNSDWLMMGVHVGVMRRRDIINTGPLCSDDKATLLMYNTAAILRAQQHSSTAAQAD
jgi:hypothetical protein